MSSRLVMLALIGSFMWAARSFDPQTTASAGLTLALGFVMLASFFSGQIAGSLGLPKLTGYLAIGVIAGPGVLGLLGTGTVERMQLVNGVAISLIALTAGGELSFRRTRPLLRSIAWITLIAVVGTTLLLAGAVLLLRPLLPFVASLDTSEALSAALVLGIVLAAQSPAVVIAVRSELRADGPVTRTLLGVVVVADLVIIVLFALGSAVARATFDGEADAIGTLATLAWELFGSMGAGLVAGGVLLLYLSRVRGGASLFVVGLCIVIAEVGTELRLDPLIAALTAGVLVENASDEGHRLLEEIAGASLPLYLVFFAVAGANIHLDTLATVGVPAVVLVAVRAVGLLGGTRLATGVAGGPPAVGRYVGFGLLPQAGLAIALSLLFARTFPELREAAALTMAVVAINELVAPVFFRRALIRSGEGRVGDDLGVDPTVDAAES